MARPTNKTELIAYAQQEYAKLLKLISEMPDQNISFNFVLNPSMKEAHWKRDKNLRDVLVHLYEWHQLLLNWIKANQAGDAQPFLPAPYNWRNYGQMNIEFWQKYQSTSLEEAKQLFNHSHAEVLKLAETFSDEELFIKKYFAWTGTSSLGAYFVSATSSHYDWAIKKLKKQSKV